MIKNSVFMIRARRMMAIILCCVVMITLSGCGSSANRNPYGELDTSAVYAQSGNESITVQELYDELRYNSLGYFNTMVEEAVFASYIETVANNVADYTELLTEYILDDIYGTHDEDEMDALTSATVASSINLFIDEMYYQGITISYDEVENQDFSKVYSVYYIDVAQYIYAKEQLLIDIEENDEEAEDDDDLYFTTDEYVTYYTNNYANTGDVEGVIVRFINETEVEETMKEFGIKSYKNEWYLISLPDDLSTLENTADYDDYYDNYEVDPLGNEENSIKIDSGFEEGESSVAILKIFVEIYNYIYTYRNTLDYTGRIDADTFEDYGDQEFLKYYYLTSAIVAASNPESSTYDGVTYDDLTEELVDMDKQGEYTNFTKEKLDKYSTSLSSYLYGTLETEPNTEDDEDNTSFIQYNSSPNSYGNYYYLIFKISAVDDEEFYTVEELYDEDEEEYYDEYTITNDDLKLEIYELMFEEALTETYITTVVDERMAEADIAIYDSILEINYVNSTTYDYKETKKSNDSLIGSVTIDDVTTEFTVDDAYEFLEFIYGPTTAVTLLFNKYIKTTEYYTDLDEYYDDYKLAVQTALTYFANDDYSSYGYPATMGKYNFMQLYYRTTNVDEAVTDYLMVEDAKADFFADYSDTFYEDLKYYTDLAYDSYYGLSATHLLVYVDMDEDGVADTDFFSDPEYAAEYQEYAEALVAEVVSYVQNSSSNTSTSLEAAVEEFNSSSRIVPSVCNGSNSATTECTWAEYKSKGLFLSTATLAEITNTTDSDEDDLVSRIKELYEDTDVIMNGYYTSSYFDSERDLVLTEDGYNVLLITGGTVSSSSEYLDEDELYQSIPIKIDGEAVYLNGSSSTEYATLEQIEIYVREYTENSACTSLPADVITALDTYLAPLMTRYITEVSLVMIMMNTMDTISGADSDFTTKLDKMIDIAQKNTDSYADISTGNYQNWWTKMYD